MNHLEHLILKSQTLLEGFELSDQRKWMWMVNKYTNFKFILISFFFSVRTVSSKLRYECG